MIRKLEWDSVFFEQNIADLSAEHQLPEWDEVAAFLSDNKVDLTQALCALDNIAFSTFLETHGFHLIDCKMDFKLKLDKNIIAEAAIDQAVSGDFAELNSFASEIFVHSRYFNRYFKPDLSAKFYSVWLQKSIDGNFDDLCLISRIDNKISGFVTVRVKSHEARIGLIGVNPRFAGRSVGSLLIKQAANYAVAQNCTVLKVATQGCNIKAVNFYLKNGFLVDSIANWYYLSSKEVNL